MCSDEIVVNDLLGMLNKSNPIFGYTTVQYVFCQPMKHLNIPNKAINLNPIYLMRSIWKSHLVEELLEAWIVGVTI
jgi:hypothetical protein